MNTNNSAYHSERESILFDSREQCLFYTLELLQLARRQICFFGPILDPVLLDEPDIIDVLTRFSRAHDKARIKLLIHNSQKNAANGHRLITLAQKLTSSIEIRLTSKPYQSLTQLYLLADDSAYLYCPHHTRYQGRASFNDIAETRQLQQSFDIMWQHGTPDSTLRRLHI